MKITTYQFSPLLPCRNVHVREDHGILTNRNYVRHILAEHDRLVNRVSQQIESVNIHEFRTLDIG